MSIRKDFAGINICVYDPLESDSGSFGGNSNTIGYDPSKNNWYTDAAGVGNNSSITSHGDKNTLVLLNLHRNGVWGYSTWKQIRASQNPLTRNQIKNSVYSYIPPCGLEEIKFEPGIIATSATGQISFDTHDAIMQINAVSKPNDGDELQIIDAQGNILKFILSHDPNHLNAPTALSDFSTAGLITTVYMRVDDVETILNQTPTITLYTFDTSQFVDNLITVIDAARGHKKTSMIVSKSTNGIAMPGGGTIASQFNLNITQSAGINGNVTNGISITYNGSDPGYVDSITQFSGGSIQYDPSKGQPSSFMYKRKNCAPVHTTEPMVTSKYLPLEYNFGYMMKDSRLAEFTLKADLTNNCRFFTNDKLNEIYAIDLMTTEDYEQAKIMYLDNALNNSHNPIDSVELIKYREVVYPKESNTFLSKTRQRDKYVSGFWRLNREERKYPLEREHGYVSALPLELYEVYEPFSTPLGPSSWCLDARDSFLTSLVSMIGFDGGAINGQDGATEDGTNLGCSDGSGLLQNSYSQFGHFNQTGKSGANQQLDKNPTHLKDAPTYYHRHAVGYTSSLVSPSGINNPAFNSGYPNGYIPSQFYFRGDTLFTAHLDRETFTTSPSGLRTYKVDPRPPFYDSYMIYSEFTRLLGQDYSVVPEFNISENLEFYLNAGAVEKNLSIFTVKGSKIGSSTPIVQSTKTQHLSPLTDLPALKSTADDFYETYSNSDFLKMFDIVEVDNKDTLQPSVLKLTCKAIKKLLPYDGFYPSTRTTQIADQFYSSYSDNIKTDNGGVQIWFDRDPSNDIPETVNLASASAWTSSPARIKPINTALFSPGILFNTIKSGLACDYPNIQARYSVDQKLLAVDASAPLSKLHDGNYTTMISEVKGAAIPNDFSLIKQAYTVGTSSIYYNNPDVVMPYFDNRIPFEALANPEAYMSSYTIVDTEAHPRGNTGLVNSLNGTTDNRYKLMMNNFLAEVPRFFLKNKRFSTFQSFKQGNPKFGNVKNSNNIYGMRIKIKRSMSTEKIASVTETNSASIFLPQDVTGESENFTMYSRPSAFGPATCGISGPHSRGNQTGPLSTNGIDNDEYNHRNGYNFPFTPVYYHGEAWADIIFKPPAGTEGKVTIDQIFENSKLFQLRFWQGNDNEFGTKLVDGQGTTAQGSQINSTEIENLLKGAYYANPSGMLGQVVAGMQFSLSDKAGSIGVPINYNAMQVSSSVNIFNKVGMKEDVSSFNLGPLTIETNTNTDNDARWIIQTKFETPAFNFNHLNPQLSATSENPYPGVNQYHWRGGGGYDLGDLSNLQARGLWHQYGRIPEDDEGIFIEITDIPEQWWAETRTGIYERHWNDDDTSISTSQSLPSQTPKSLADLVGLPKNQPKRIGELAERKTIKEAVVAVPFKVVDGRRKYFSIDREDINDALRVVNGDKDGENTVGKSIVAEVKAMKEYVIPPEFNFLEDSNIDPFAMYFFEFKHELSKQDLSDIWQNILPNIGITHELAESEISHELLSNELMGTKRKKSNASKIIRDNKQNLFDSEIQWMVFKVKQRANKSYNNLMYGNEKEEVGYSYNWPYDYFSLVELVKIEAEVEFSDIQEEEGRRKPKKIRSKRLQMGDINFDGNN